MANHSQVMGLIQCHKSGDMERFDQLLRAMKTEAEHKRQTSVAKDYAAFIGVRPGTRGLTLLPEADKARSLVCSTNPAHGLDALALASGLRGELSDVLIEQGASEALAEFGLGPARRLIFAGPPGVGKTAVASALAFELGLPLHVVRLDALVDSHMGETSKNLQRVFDSAGVNKGVWLLDEVDAVLAGRVSGNSGADREANLIVGAALAGLDRLEAGGLLLAATNRPEALDPAVVRRFDRIIRFGLPGKEEAMQVIAEVLAPLRVGAQVVAVASDGALAAGLSHSQITDACRWAIRRYVLGWNRVFRLDEFLAALPTFGGDGLSPHEAIAHA